MCVHLCVCVCVCVSSAESPGSGFHSSTARLNTLQHTLFFYCEFTDLRLIEVRRIVRKTKIATKVFQVSKKVFSVPTVVR